MPPYLRKLIFKLLLVYVFFAITRLLFLSANYSFFDQFSLPTLASTFFYGLLFDTSAIVYFNGLFLIFYLFPTPYRTHPVYQKTLDALLAFGTTVALCLNLIDVSLFPFSKQRSGMEIISMKDDIINLLPALLKDYWYMLLVLILFLFSFLLLNNRWIGRVTHAPEKWRFKGYTLQVIFFLLWSGLLVIGARGGFYLRPIRAVDASRFVEPKLTPVVTNTPMQFISTFKNRSIPNFHFFPEETKDNYIEPVKRYSNGRQGPHKNIVIIILESFAKEYIGYFNQDMKGFTPFFDSLCREGITFPNSYANGLHSVDATPAIISGIPALMRMPYIKSNFQTNRINSIGKLLRQEFGYHCSFYHGGQNGTMAFDNFIRLSDHGDYYGMNEYPNPSEDGDGSWGIFDEPYLQYFARQLEKEKQPFCSTVFTLSSHHPFRVPEKYQESLPKGELPIYQSIAYADLALKKFFKTASQMDWYDNTLFILTADHTAITSPSNDLYSTSYNMFSVPIILYNHDLKSLPDRSKTVQHIDILPTILDYLGYEQPFFALGSSMLDTSRRGYAAQQHYNYFQMIERSWLLEHDGKKVRNFYNIHKDPYLQNPLDTSKFQQRQYLTNRLKAVLQEYSNRLHENNLHYKY